MKHSRILYTQEDEDNKSIHHSSFIVHPYLRIKQYKSCAILLFLFLFPSCSDWLDVQPVLEMKKEKMFETEDGFKSVLTGVYIRLVSSSLYGNNTTMIVPELLAHHWTTSTNTFEDHLSLFDYENTSVKNRFSTIWQQYYQAITNLNSLLEEIDLHKTVFVNGNYELIKGEALGLRGFLHFELLRLWGDAPADIRLSESAIPYVKKVTKNANELRSLPYREVFDYILEDLNVAEELLKNDPVIYCSMGILNAPGRTEGYEEYNRPDDEFHYYRQNRFNYYAVKAIKARYYLWLGNTTLARQYAEEVINALNVDGDKGRKFTLGETVHANAGNLTFTTEHIFSLYSSNASSLITPLFVNTQGGYTQNIDYLRNAYEASDVIGINDIRFVNNRLWEQRAVSGLGYNYNYFKKYVNTDGRTAKDVIPVIRLSELYFIAVECGNTALFNAYRNARLLNIDITGLSEEELRKRMEKEYRKEFYGEGQMFFFYKRLKYENYEWPLPYAVPVAKYKIPQPDEQILFE
jgi:hypothetical protein